MHAFSTGRADLVEALEKDDEELVKQSGAKEAVILGSYLTRIAATNDADLLIVVLYCLTGNTQRLNEGRVRRK